MTSVVGSVVPTVVLFHIVSLHQGRLHNTEVKPGFHMPGKSQTIGNFADSPSSQFTDMSGKSLIVAEIWHTSGKLKRSRFSRFIPTIRG